MPATALRRQILLSTTMIVGALTGYGGRAYAQGCTGGGGVYTCTGYTTTGQTINANNATVSTNPPFEVNTTDAIAISITGDGSLSYMDAYASDLTASTAGLVLNVTPGPGSIDINATGDITGGAYGVSARSLTAGGGYVNVITGGDVTATTAGTGIGISAQNAGTSLGVSTGAGTTVSGATGIRTYNTGNGSTTILTYGNVTGSAGAAIDAENYSASSTSLDITTLSTVSGTNGILATNAGTGDTTINASGLVTGTSNIGIFARNTAATGGSILITTGPSVVSGAGGGIYARNAGAGAVTINANGAVFGYSGYGIQGYNSAAGTNLSITTALSVTGDLDGIHAQNRGNGLLTVTANGDVTGGTLGVGIRAVGDGSAVGNPGIGVTVTTNFGTVSGGQFGILAGNSDYGDVRITANGNVSGNAGIAATNGTNGTNLYVTTAASSTVTGTGSYGISADNAGNGQLYISADGTVTTTGGRGIQAINSTAGTDTTIISAVGHTVSGTTGVYANHAGTGALTVNTSGTVTGTTTRGIDARSTGTMSGDLSVTTGTYTVTGANNGVYAVNFGMGATTINAYGNVTGTSAVAIRGYNVAVTTTALTITTAAGTTVTGGTSSISAQQNGSGLLSIGANGSVYANDGTALVGVSYGAGDIHITSAASTTIDGTRRGMFSYHGGAGATEITALGQVYGTTYEGIRAIALNTATSVTITTGASSTVSGNGGIAALNYGSGPTTITAYGAVTGTTGDGIYVYTGTGANITVNAGSSVTSNGINAGDFGIQIASGAASVTVGGTLNGGGGGAVQFADATNTLELVTGATVTGNVIGGTGTDTLTLSGTDSGIFNVSQLQNFEAVDVEAGTWSLSGITTADAQVNGGTLMGTGTFGDLTVNNGTLAPGNSIGTMTVNGAFTLGAGSVFEVEVNAAGQSDRVIVNGTVNLTGATLRVLAENGKYKPSTDYVIIQNDGVDPVVGTFASITSSLAFLVPTVVYNGGTGNDVVLTLAQGSTQFVDVAKTRNQRAVANALSQFPETNSLFQAVLSQTAEGARQAYDALSGEIHATVAGTLADDSRYVRDSVLGRLVQASYTNNASQFASLAASGPQVASLDSQAMALGYRGKSLRAPVAEPLAFWTRAYGAWGDFDTDGNAATADRDLGGFVSGMDANIGGNWRAGLVTGASFSNVDVDARNSSADVQTYHLGGYAGGMVSAFALRAGGMWAWSDIDTSRAVIFPGFYERQKASYDADTGQLFGEVAYPTAIWGMALEPFAGLAFVGVDTDTIREHGGSLASLRGSADQDVGYTTVGLRAAQTMALGEMQITPHLSAAWLHAFDGVTPDASLTFAATGVGFTVYGVPLAEDSALIDAGLDFALGDDMTAGVSYSGQFGDGVTDNGVKGRFTWLF